MKANQKIIWGTIAAIAGAAAISMGIISTATPIMAANTISKETAKSIALKHAGINASQIYNYEIDLDNERNGVFYDVEFDSNGYEYEYRINASNASIVNVEKKALNKNTDVVYPFNEKDTGLFAIYGSCSKKISENLINSMSRSQNMNKTIKKLSI